MSCKPCQDSFINCPQDVTTTNCVSYQGESIPCLNICRGDSVTYVENAIAVALCKLITETDMSNVVLPPCLIEAWNTRDKTILEFIKFLLEESCTLQSQIDALNTELATFQPMVTVDYKCCSDSPCVTVGTVTVTEALQNIINCLCNVIQVLGVKECPLPQGESLSCMLLAQQEQINTLNSQIAAQQVTINAFTAKFECWRLVLVGDYPSLC
jgi:hypothetical protein